MSNGPTISGGRDELLSKKHNLIFGKFALMEALVFAHNSVQDGSVGQFFLPIFVIYIVFMVNEPIYTGNEMAHYFQIVAFLDGRLHIIPTIGVDSSTFGGYIYSNKPPGAALAYLPVVGILKLFYVVDEHHVMLAPIRFAAAGIAVLGAIMSAKAAQLLSDRRTGLFVLFSSAFGTLLFPYSITLTAHGLSFLLMASAIYFALKFKQSRKSSASEIAITCLASLPLVQSNNAILAAPLAFLLFISAGDNISRVRMLAIGLFFGVIFFGFNVLCFGSALVSSYTYYNNPGYVPVTFDAIGSIFAWPHHRAARLLLDPGKGLLVFSPFLIFAASGILIWKKRLAGGILLFTLATSSLLYFLLIASYNVWHGGHAIGPRHLFPLLPFLLICAGLGICSSSKTFITGLVLLFIAFLINLGALFVSFDQELISLIWVNEPADDMTPIFTLIYLVVQSFFSSLVVNETNLIFFISRLLVLCLAGILLFLRLRKERYC